MTLEEAIKHAQEVADSSCDQCAKDHQQLADWLRELKEFKLGCNKVSGNEDDNGDNKILGRGGK